MDHDEEKAAADLYKIIYDTLYKTLAAGISAVSGIMFKCIEKESLQSSPVHIRLTKNNEYWTITHPHLRDDDSTQSYRAHYRMKKKTFDKLVQILEEHPAYQLTSHNRTPTYIQVAVVLWRLANDGFGYRVIEATLGVSQGSGFNFTERFFEAVIDKLDHLISWSSTEREFRDVKHEFRHMHNDIDNTKLGLPNVIGVTDGKLISVHRPRRMKSERFRDRKNNLSINLTAVALADLKFSYVYIGESGRSHDARVFSKCDIATDMLPDTQGYFFEEAYLLGDSAYPTSYHLITPYPQAESDIDPKKARFNKKFSGMRQVVERAFGVLVKRWRFLWKYLYVLEYERMVRAVHVGCILHNYCIKEKDIVEITQEETRSYVPDTSALQTSDTAPRINRLERSSGVQRRKLLKEWVTKNRRRAENRQILL